ncbi:MAG: hypothetical protein R6X19_06065 [Kiritimatiellia bacterium]
MKKTGMLLLIAILAAGCRRDVPAPQTAANATRPAAVATNPPAGQSVGSAVVDVLTQRSTIEAGRRAKVQIEAAAAKENKDLEEALKP